MTAAPPSNQTSFLRCVAVTFDIEGRDKLSLDPSDPGNWTGGAEGVGELRGTRWGFSAAAFPQLDIANLGEAQASGLAMTHYWLPTKCQALPASLAMLVFDAAFQHGQSTAIKLLQSALTLHDDGVFGRETAASVVAVCALDGWGAAPAVFARRDLLTEYQVKRLRHMAEQHSWERDCEGLERRVARTLAAAIDFDDETHGGVA